MSNLTSWKFLVIEDEDDSMELVSGLLEHQGIRAIEAHSGEEALRILETTVPTLMVIDLALPGIDGWNVLTHVKGTPHLSSIPCVAMTAFHTAELANKAIEAGFDAYFAKPLDATSFVRELQHIAQERS